MQKNFIDLNRSFALIPKDHKLKEDDYDLSASFGLLETKKWSDLLLLRRVIILAEAGAGKTEEIRATAKGLRNRGNKAFFFRLEHLSSNFEASFEIGNNDEFKEWLSSDEPGYFFLDSVDEARLCGPKQFESAIRNFGVRLADSKQRTHIFITSRLSEWRAQSDLSLIKNQLPFVELSPSTEEHSEKKIKAEEASFSSGFSSGFSGGGERKFVEPSVFSLCPLDHEQIKTFSQAFGVKDLGNFLKSIERAEADIFSSRPLDLIELINYWTQFGKLANRAELIKSSISSKLKETDPDRAAALPLTIEETKLGAKMLAAAVTFQRQDRILVLEQTPDPAIKAESIDVQSVLTSWRNEQSRALLQRPIFDKAIYGTVRFHHRCVHEYLTAKWLHQLLLNGKPRRAIENLFFKERYGQMVLVPSMRPVLSWLILFDDRIRKKTAKIAPEVLIQGGDPSVLPANVRKNIVEKFCVLYADQNITDLSFDISELRRFAHPDLGETINRLLSIYSGHDEILYLLLRIVWQGKIECCSEKALAFALDDANDTYMRIYGIRIIETVGSEDQKNKLIASLIDNPTFKSKRLIGELITAFVPDTISTRDVLPLIKRIEKPESYSGSGIRRSLKEFCLYKCPEEDILKWVRGLLHLLKKPPTIKRRFFKVSQQHSWLLPFAVLAAERIVRIKHPNALDENILEIISLAQAERSFGNYHSENHALAELVPKWPELNRALFWFDVALTRRHQDKKYEKRLTNWQQVGVFDHFWRFTAKGFENILKDIGVRSYMDDRLVALSLSFEIYKENGRGKVRRLLMRKAVQGEPELEDALNLYLKPPPMSDDVRRWRRKNADFKRRQKQREKKKADNRRKWREWLQSNISVLCDTSIAADGRVWRATNYLRDELRDKRNSSHKWARANWEDLIPEFGQDVAEAYRDGCIDYWRKYYPKIRSESIENPNSKPNAVIVGLGGLEMESGHIHDWPRNLSVDEAKLACRYAVHELNGFPNWLPKLHSVFPETVETSILTEIEWEFSKYNGDSNCHYVLDDVVWQLDWLKFKISSRIISFLKEYEPKHDDTVRKALGIVLASPGLDQAAFAEIAKTKVLTIKPGNRQALWLAAWMCVDAKGAIETLHAILSKTADAKYATELSMLFIVALLGERRENIQRVYQDYTQTDILLSLIKLMHSHIRSEDDINRVGTGAYSPGLRDNAQDARNRLFQLLCDISGKPTYLAMMYLAQHHPDEQSRHRYTVYAKRRAEADAESEPWKPGDISLFAEEAERAPQNHRELYDLIVFRLLDLKADLEDGDTSLAKILVPVTHETEHRNFIGGWLRDRSLGRYSVPQEEELADAKRPDIRIHGIGFDGPVPIELKVVDNNWSGKKLIERLNNQLCGQYLRDIRSNCGIYMLIYRGEKKNWKHPESGKNMDFYGLVQLLEKEAEKIIAADKKIEAIKIVDIDLTKRTMVKLIKP
ncbi:MAG: hypothetical protein JRD05_10365 [Deltaproteobacteria bacterium]|nr:hypothetical protein [Deltaproteobacteria bacterium]